MPTTDCFVWTWGHALAVALIYGRIEKRKYKVIGYRTGVPARPWGYSVRRVT